MSNFLLGGRMGDLIHMLYVVKNSPGKHDLFITDKRELHSDGFIYPLEKTIEELKPLLLQQDYINSVQAYEGPVTENTVIKEGEYINLNMWRRYVYSASWTNLLSKTFNVPINDKPWIKLPMHFKPASKIIHCSKQPARKGNWHNIDLRKGWFIGNDEEYESFGHPMKRIKTDTLVQLFYEIKNADPFIGNQSLPLAIAHSLDVPRIAVLNEGDKAAYIGEEKIYSNFSYVL